MATETCTRTVTVNHVDGLHTRPCVAIAKMVGKHQARVTIQSGAQSVNAGSVLDLLSLAATQGTRLVLSATGVDAEVVIEALTNLFAGPSRLTTCQ